MREQLAPLLHGMQRTCMRKIAYRSQEKAEHHAQARMRAVPDRLYVYRCTQCDLWHITKMEQGDPT